MSETHDEDQDTDFETATEMVQIFSAVAFAGLMIWLCVANGHRLSFIRKASLGKRLITCCNVCVYVAFMSAFCNLLQLTQLDNAVLPRQSNYVIDLARPIEWILTCPFLQFAVVILGGPRIPESRMFIMPGFSIVILGLGTLTQVFNDMLFVWLCFSFAFCICMTMFYFNRKQILENSAGEEDIHSGDSVFRKISICLVLTWLPFPIWFALSPEGIGWVTDVFVIQFGFAFLNILSKFTQIILIQSVKDNYTATLKRRFLLTYENTQVKKAPQSPNGTFDVMPDFHRQNSPFSDKSTTSADRAVQLAVFDALEFLGLIEYADSFYQLFLKNQLYTAESVLTLNQKTALAMDVPWELVSIVQLSLTEKRAVMVEDGMRNVKDVECQDCIQTQRRLSQIALTNGDSEACSPTSATPRGVKKGNFTPCLDGCCDARFGSKSDMKQLEDVVQVPSLANKLDEVLSIVKTLQTQKGPVITSSGPVIQAPPPIAPQAPASVAREVANAVDPVYEKLDVLPEQILGSMEQMISQCMKKVASEFCRPSNTGATYEQCMMNLKQNQETLHSVLIQHQSAAEERHGKKFDALLKSMTETSEKHARSTHEMNLNLAKVHEAIDESSFKAMAQKEELQAFLNETNNELMRGINEVPSKVCTSMEPVLTSQQAKIQEKISDLRGSFNFGMESVVGRLIQTVEGEMTSIKATNANTTEGFTSELQKYSRSIEETMAASLKWNVDQITMRLNELTIGLSNTMKESSENVAGQVLHASSAMHDVTATSLRNQMANFQAVQFQQHNNLERKMEMNGALTPTPFDSRPGSPTSFPEPDSPRRMSQFQQPSFGNGMHNHHFHGSTHSKESSHM